MTSERGASWTYYGTRRRMAPARIALAVVFLLGTSGVTAAAEIPDRFLFPYDGLVIWISETAAISEDGRLRPGVIEPEELRVLRRQAAAHRAASPSAEGESGGCNATFFEACDVDLASPTTFGELVDAAATRSVVSGIVSRSAIGLHQGLPYTVLQIERDVPGKDGAVAYLLYPKAKLRFEGMTVCQDDPRFAPPPAVGDVVTFLTRSALDVNGTLFMTDGSTLLYDRHGTLVLPPGLESDAELRRIGSARKLAQVLRETREERRETQPQRERE